MANDTDAAIAEATEGLRNKNAELLGKLKKASEDLQAAQAELATVTAARDQALADFQRVAVDKPVGALLDQMSVAPRVLKTMLAERGYRFALEDGAIVLRDAEGNVPTVRDGRRGHDAKDRPAAFNAADLTAVLCETWAPSDARSEAAREFATVIKAHLATGGGSVGMHRSAPAAEAPRSQPAPAFGLR